VEALKVEMAVCIDQFHALSLQDQTSRAARNLTARLEVLNPYRLLDADQPQAVLEDVLHLVLLRRLGVDADERLGAGEAHKQPACVAQLELVAVERVDACYLQPGQRFGAGAV